MRLSKPQFWSTLPSVARVLMAHNPTVLIDCIASVYLNFPKAFIGCVTQW